MPDGLRVWDSTGKLQVEITSRLTKYVTNLTTTLLDQQSSNHTITNMLNNGKWAVLCFPPYASITINTGSFTVKNQRTDGTTGLPGITFNLVVITL